MTDTITAAEVLNPETKIAAYSPFYAELARLEADNRALTFNYADPKGNKEARSHIHKLRLSKGALDRARQQEKADVLERGRAIDGEAKALTARIDAMIEVHQVEIDRIEQLEKDRIAAHVARIDGIKACGADCATAAQLAQAIADLHAVAVDDSFEEYAPEAAAVKAHRLEALAAQHQAMQKAEADALELAELRRKAAEQAARDEAERIQREADERAKAAAAEALAEQERRAQAERDAAAKREADLKAQAEAAEQARRDAEARAERERVAAEARAKLEAEEAVRAEQARVAQQKARQEMEDAARAADKEHRRAINQGALAAFVKGGMTDECAKQAIALIAQGLVPNVAISY